MSKLSELIEQLCPDGVEYQRIGEIAEVGTGSSNGNEAIEDGEYPFYVRSQIVKAKDDYEFDEEAIIIPGEGGIGEIFHYVNGKYALHQRVYRIHFTTENINVKFAFYYMQAQFKAFIMKKAVSATVTSIRKPMVEGFQIPVPPLEVQCEIVRILDNFTELTTELTTELAARKEQYEYYRDHLFTFSNDVPQVELGDYFPHIRNGFVGTATPYFTTEEDGIRYLKGTNIHNGIISDNDYCYITPAFHQKHIRNELKADDILVVQSGHVGECAVVGEKYAGANCHALIIMSNGGQCSSKFVVHYLRSTEGKRKIAAITTGGTVKHILASEIKKFKIPFPPIAEQERIVELLDRFDSLCNDITLGLPAEIEVRQKQFEYYRDKLLTFDVKQ